MISYQLAGGGKITEGREWDLGIEGFRDDALTSPKRERGVTQPRVETSSGEDDVRDSMKKVSVPNRVLHRTKNDWGHSPD